MRFRIDRAAPADADDLTALAHAAKRHWGYSKELIALWCEALTFTAEYVKRHCVFVARTNDRAIGVYALVRSDGEAELDHLWVDPDFLGRGAGRALLDHAIATAHGWGVASIDVASDPNAEGFYLRMGAARIGDVQSIPEGRRLPLLRISV